MQNGDNEYGAGARTLARFRCDFTFLATDDAVRDGAFAAVDAATGKAIGEPSIEDVVPQCTMVVAAGEGDVVAGVVEAVVAVAYGKVIGETSWRC